MENLNNDDQEDDENSLDLLAGKAKKKAKELGSILFQPKAEKQSEDDPTDEPKKWWELLDSGPKTDNQEHGQGEEESALVQITPEEIQMIESQLAISKLMAEEAAPVEFDEDVATEQAVNDFRQKIASEGMTSDEALAETIKELDLEQPQPEAELVPAHASELHIRPKLYTVEKPEPMLEEHDQPAEHKTDHAVSGFTDYLYQKRLGRQKAAEKPDLAPVRKKLEKQVREIKADLVRKEDKIRQIAKETKRQQPEKRKAQASAETLTRQELLAKSEKIIVDSTNLRQVYETHLITERGLRRIIAEYERGGDYKHQLKSELLEHQIDFERDPQMRDKQRDNTVMAGGKAALNSMLAKVDSLSADQAKDELAFYKAREMHRTIQQDTSKKRRRTADLLMLATISVLLALVLIMLFTRG